MNKITKISDLVVGQYYYLCFTKGAKPKKSQILAIINETAGFTEIYALIKFPKNLGSMSTNLLYACEIGLGNTEQEAKDNYGKFNFEENPNFSTSFESVRNKLEHFPKDKEFLEKFELKPIDKITKSKKTTFSQLPKNLYQHGFATGVKNPTPIDEDKVKEIISLCEPKFQKTRNIMRTQTSYELKHKVEKILDYTSNGNLIAAMLLMGFDYEIVDNQNAYFNLSDRSIQNLQTN